ncbi:MAG: hypothetical protein FWH42_04185 [Dehalococcoidia bacterium]|nr:hypothetical protein [Dehalococcoidia bacterium]
MGKGIKGVISLSLGAIVAVVMLTIVLPMLGTLMSDPSAADFVGLVPILGIIPVIVVLGLLFYGFSMIFSAWQDSRVERD